MFVLRMNSYYGVMFGVASNKVTRHSSRRGGRAGCLVCWGVCCAIDTCTFIMLLALCKLHRHVHPGSDAAAECHKLAANARRALLLCILLTAGVASIATQRALCMSFAQY
jgi:hypothetical protein